MRVLTRQMMSGEKEEQKFISPDDFFKIQQSESEKISPLHEQKTKEEFSGMMEMEDKSGNTGSLKHKQS